MRKWRDGCLFSTKWQDFAVAPEEWQHEKSWLHLKKSLLSLRLCRSSLPQSAYAADSE